MAETETPNTEAPKDNNRKYEAFKPFDLNLADGEALQKLADEVGVQTKILIQVGSVVGDSPRKAINNLGKDTDLAGDYVIVAKTALNEFNGVSSATERVVKIPTA